MKRVHVMLCWLLLCVAVHADPLNVRIIGKAECLDGAQLRVSPEGGKALLLLKTVPEKSAYSVPLPATVAVTVEVTRDGCWGDRRLWSPGDDAEVELRMYAAATVTGELTGAGAATVRDVHAQIYLRDGVRAGEGLPLSSLGNSTCTVTNARWRCTVPADVLFDLRLDVPGFASSYHWDVSSAASDLGPQPLVAGASIAGWIADPNGKPLPHARVTLFPLESQHTGRQYSAASLRTVRSDRRGFFQFAGLPAASYRLVSEAPKLSPAVVAEIGPRTGEAVTLPVPLRHAEPGELVLTFDPPADRQGHPWSVQLTEAAPLYPAAAGPL